MVRQTVKRQVTLSNLDEIFLLVVRLEIRRQDPVDEEFLDMRGVRSQSYEIEPLEVVGGRDEEELSGAISEFASQFEQVFQNTKLATRTGSRRRCRNRLTQPVLGGANGF